MRKVTVLHKPGDIVRIAGTEFVVLDVQRNAAMDGEDKLFVLLKNPVGHVEFSKNESINYKISTLREETGDWFEKFAEGINRVYFYSREIDLTTFDGREDYGVFRPLVAPLTLAEWNKFRDIIPDSGESYWLATGYGAWGSRATHALRVCSDGGHLGSRCSNSWALRPAMIVSSRLVDGRKSGLGKYTTEQLLEEIQTRKKINNNS